MFLVPLGSWPGLLVLDRRRDSFRTSRSTVDRLVFVVVQLRIAAKGRPRYVTIYFLL